MKPSISVITATLNVAADLPKLIESLRKQSDRQFEYIVIDGGSTDGTWSIIDRSRDVVTYAVSEPDLGIYYALNKALLALRTDFYIVVGADDQLYPDAIANFKTTIRNTDADVVVAQVRVGKSVRKGFFPKRAWLGHPSMVTSHSVGMAFRYRLHEQFGTYAVRYPILADGHFIKRVCTAPDVRAVGADFIAGEFGESGSSHRHFVRALWELRRLQVDTGENPIIQFFLLHYRLLRYWLRGIAKLGASTWRRRGR